MKHEDGLHVVVAALMYKKQVLFQNRKNNTFLWTLPGGKVEPKESSNWHIAINREIKEELGVDLKFDDQHLFMEVKGGLLIDGLRYTVHAYTYALNNNEVMSIKNNEPDKFVGIGWFDSDQPPSNTHPYDKPIASFANTYQEIQWFKEGTYV